MFKSFFFNLNNLKKINNLRNSIVLNNYLANNNFIIFCDINKAKNFNLLNLINDIKKLNCKSFFSNNRLIKLDLNLKFLGSHFLIIFASNLEILSKLIALLNNDNI